MCLSAAQCLDDWNWWTGRRETLKRLDPDPDPLVPKLQLGSPVSEKSLSGQPAAATLLVNPRDQEVRTVTLNRSSFERFNATFPP